MGAKSSVARCLPMLARPGCSNELPAQRKVNEKPQLSVITSRQGDGAADSADQNMFIQAMSERDFAKKYRLGKMVMESGHPGMSVLFAERLADKLQVVVKIRSKQCSWRRVQEEMDWRATMEAQLSLPKADTICDLMEVIETMENYYVVMERIDGMDLFDTAMHTPLSHGDVREVTRQILEALAFLHGAGRIHKDMKLENVMIERSPRKSRRSTMKLLTPSTAEPASPMSAKLIDFDTMEDWEPDSPRAKHVLGTNGYIAPEAYKGAYSPASDVFSAGVMLYTLLVRHFPYRKDMFDDEPGENIVGSPAMDAIYERFKTSNIDFSCAPFDRCQEVADLCRGMLIVDPSDRLSAYQALQHEWFQLPRDSLPNLA